MDTCHLGGPHPPFHRLTFLDPTRPSSSFRDRKQGRTSLRICIAHLSIRCTHIGKRIRFEERLFVAEERLGQLMKKKSEVMFHFI
ncbi:hypothetical protein CEXT_227051 [Caerostris extrusa]|uniref:Uncharacterized protein n=1 Tax=Caerostris extrusa TaxID=172846 RepID=A0AAV4N9P3_CAEEX|nr:hypothetical protein CEXT_227051 [Caerostris extrusa]